MKTKNKTISILLIAITLFSSGCATIFTGTKQKITFKSNVDGRVFQNLNEIGKTNQIIKIRREDIIKLYTIKVDGCPDKQMELPVKSNPIVWLDLPFALFGYGLIWAYVDVATGANIRTPKIVNVQMDCTTKSK